MKKPIGAPAARDCVRYPLYLPPDTYYQLKLLAVQRRTRLHALIVEMIDTWLKANEMHGFYDQGKEG